MSKTKFLKILSGLLTVMLIAVIAFTVTGCSSDNETPADTSTVSTTAPDLAVAEILGEGKTSFNFKVIDPEGNEKSFEIRTDKETVGEALLETGLIEGEDGPYGLYVKGHFMKTDNTQPRALTRQL